MHPVEPGSEPAESPPGEIIEAAKSVYSSRSFADVAPVVYDSLLEENASPEDHVLRFEHDRVAFTVGVSAGPAEISLSGEVSPPSAGRFELIAEGSELTFVAESEGGRFSFGPLGHGLIRLSFEPPGGSPVLTDWFRV